MVQRHQLPGRRQEGGKSAYAHYPGVVPDEAHLPVESLQRFLNNPEDCMFVNTVKAGMNQDCQLSESFDVFFLN
jgi:hypothetical protein